MTALRPPRRCRAAATPSRTGTNQADHRPLGFLIQQRVRFAWVFLLILRIEPRFGVFCYRV
jgi:hypothetical protein